MTHRRFAPLVSLALVLMLPAAAQASHRAVSASGVKQVDGETLYVDVFVALKHGQSAREATGRALSEQGATRRKKRPGTGGGGGGGGGGGEQYFYTGLKWSPPSVTQNYNAANEPLSAKSALTSTHSTWNGNSDFSIRYGQDVSRCPSLVRECQGPQVKDPYNDVAWLPLSGNTLGVTWSTASSPEADMALNTRFRWKDTCDTTGTGYDVETVLLHENGHVAGLDHPNRTDSVMYASYQAPRCTLYDYDRLSLANLY